MTTIRYVNRTTDFQQQQVAAIMTRSDLASEVSVLQEVQNVMPNKDVDAKVEERVKGIVSNHGQISGCTLNKSLKM